MVDRSSVRSIASSPGFMASQAYAVFEIEGPERLPSIQELLGIVRCKTWDSLAVTPNFRRSCAARGSIAHCNRTGFRQSNALPEQTRGRFLVLAGNPVREEDRPS